MSTTADHVAIESLELGNPVDRKHAERLAFRLSSILVGVAVVTCSLTAWSGALRGTPAMNGSARGTALVMLFLGVGAVATGMVLVARFGSFRGRVVWAGGLAYLTYNAVMLCFGTPFNPLFLGYVATLGLSLWSLVTTLTSTRYDDAWRGSDTRPAALYLLAVVVSNTAVWLTQIIPALSDRTPRFLAGTGLTTSPVFVQDLAVWLPVMAVAGVMLWSDHAWSLLVGGAGLLFWQIEAIGVAVDQWFGHHADPDSPVASLGGAYLFATVFAVGMIPTMSVLGRLPGHDLGD